MTDYYGKSKKVPKWWKKITDMKLGKVVTCQDHTSFGEDCVYFEPYPTGINQIKELTKFCETHGLDLEIRGDSTWNPNNTFLIKITKNK